MCMSDDINGARAEQYERNTIALGELVRAVREEYAERGVEPLAGLEDAMDYAQTQIDTTQQLVNEQRSQEDVS